MRRVATFHAYSSRILTSAGTIGMKASRDWQMASKPLCYLSSFMIGLSVALVYALSSFESYLLMSRMVSSPLEAQGLWFFMRRFTYMLAVVVMQVMLFTTVNKRSVCVLHWLLSACYATVCGYLHCHTEISEPSILLRCLFVLLHVLSAALQFSFFFLTFDPEIPGGAKESPKYVLFHLFGCGLSACILRGLSFRGEVAATTILDAAIHLSSRVKGIMFVSSVITLLSSGLCSYLVFCILETPCKEYLTLSMWNVMRLMFNTQCVGILLYCSLGWILTPLCGVVTSTFLFNLSVQESIRLIFIQNSVYVALSLFLFVFIAYCLFEVPGLQQIDIDALSREIGNSILDNRDGVVVSGKQGKSSCDEDVALSIGKKVFRDVQPWCMLPKGFWSKWEAQDNERGIFIQQCMAVYTSMHSLIDLRPTVDVCYKTAKTTGIATFKDISNIKHRLLCLLSTFVTMCVNLCTSLQKAQYVTNYSCSYLKMREAMSSFVGSSNCLGRTWSDWNCSNDGCVDPAIMKSIDSAFCRKLLVCINSANHLAREIRRCPQLCDDLYDASLYEAVEYLEKFFMQFLVLLYSYQDVEDWIELCEYMDDIQNRCEEGIKEFGNHTCRNEKAPSGEAIHTKEPCGCECLLLLAMCSQMLHKLYCGMATMETGVLSNSVTKIPSSSHTRSLLLIVSHFVAVSKSSLASTKSSHPCCQTAEDGCLCCRYSSRLHCLLERWLSDVSSSTSSGDSLLHETIDLVSYVTSNGSDRFISKVPMYLNVLRTFVGVSRQSAAYASGIYNNKVMTSFEYDKGMKDGCGDITVKDVPNFCCDCDKPCKGKNCHCFMKECDNCNNVDACTFEILNSVATWCNDTDWENVCKCLTDAVCKLENMCEELKGISDIKNLDKESIDTIGRTVKTFFSGLVSGSPHIDVTSHQCGPQDTMNLCRISCVNKDLMKFLVSPCTLETDGNTSCTIVCKGPGTENSVSTCNGSSGTPACSNVNCRSLSCVLKKFFDTLYGAQFTTGVRKPCCSQEGTIDGTIDNRDGLYKILEDCCITLGKLEGKLHGPEGLDVEMNCLLNTIESISCLMCDINKALATLQQEYLYYQECLCRIRDEMDKKFHKELGYICQLKAHLDKSGTAYACALKAATTVAKSLSSLSLQHQSDIFLLDSQVNSVTQQYNKLAGRGQNIEGEHIKCAEGLEAERQSLVLTTKSNHDFVEVTTKDKAEYVLDVVNSYMWYFNCIWFVLFLIFISVSLFSSDSNRRIYSIGRNLSLLIIVKGALTSYSYFGSLCTYKRYQGYLINISMVFGLLIAVCISWICQWHTYNLFLSEHSRSIWKWFRILHPTSLRDESIVVQWYRGICSLIRADLSYMSRFLFRGKFGGYTYGPFGTTLYRQFKDDMGGVSFAGLCKWPPYERSLLSEIYKASTKGSYTGLLDYLAFKATPKASLMFLLKTPLWHVQKIPNDLVWTAWRKGLVITLKHYAAYSLLERAYTRVFATIQYGVYRNSRVKAPREHLLNSFNKTHLEDIANKVMDLQFDNAPYLSKRQMSALQVLFEDYYRHQWSEHHDSFSAETEGTHSGGEHPSLAMPTTRDGMRSWVKGLSNAASLWSTSRTQRCDTVYGGSDECKRIVASTAAKVSGYLTTLVDAEPGISFEMFLEEYIRFTHIPTEMSKPSDDATQPGRSSDQSSATTKHSNNVLRSRTINANNRGILIDTLSPSFQDHISEAVDRERLNLHSYLLGEWLRRTGHIVSSSDVKQILEYSLPGHHVV